MTSVNGVDPENATISNPPASTTSEHGLTNVGVTDQNSGPRRRRAALEGISGALSTQPNPTPQWKQEINRRVAAHKNRKNGQQQDLPVHTETAAPTKAAQAAARVAARYAKAPTYSQMQAEEARVAVRHAEIATKVALEAQAAAESALAGLHAATVEVPSRGPVVLETISQPQKRVEAESLRVAAASSARPEPAQARPVKNLTHDQARAEVEVHAGVRFEEPVRESIPMTVAPPLAPEPIIEPEPRYELPFAVRWDPDMPARSGERKQTRSRAQEEFELATEDWWSPGEADASLREAPIEVVEGEPVHANLIQFPRELVATRKMRPRLAEQYAGNITEVEGQLSIFEVHPDSTSAATTEAEGIASVEGAESPVTAWTGPEWSGIQLDAHPMREREMAVEAETESSTHLAPLGLRLMAAVVDCALILACFVMCGFIAASRISHPPSGKPAEVLGVVAIVLIGLLYYGLFLSLPVSTPGMKYAGIGLCTFDDQSPTREQLMRRLGAMFLSLLPVGLGFVWSVFDEDHMSWHDRYSRTYLRKL